MPRGNPANYWTPRTMQTHPETARDLATLHEILPPCNSPAFLALKFAAELLQAERPDLNAARQTVAIGLDSPDADDAEARALLAALAALLAGPAWTPHTGDRCPVPADALVWADLGDGAAPFIEQAQYIDWGPGAGPAGQGSVHRYALAAAPAA